MWTTLATAILALGLSGCSRSGPEATALAESQTAVAWVGHRPIEEAGFVQAWNRRPRATRDEMLETLVRQELLLAEIHRTGFDQRPDIREAWQAHLLQRFAEERRQQIANRPEPTAEELGEYYRSRSERFESPARARVAILQVRAPASHADGPKARWESDIARIRQQALSLPPDVSGFGPLAREVSEHRSTRFQGGDLGWMTMAQLRACLPDEVTGVVDSATDMGRVSPWIATSQGFFLVKVIERQPAALLPFDSVRERVRYECSQANRDAAEQAYLENLRASFGVRTNEFVLSRLTAPSAVVAAAPPSLPAR